MATAIQTLATQVGGLTEPIIHFKPLWYAAHTVANHEKRVAEQLGGREIEYFLPLYASVRQWKDRRVRLELPFFPGYILVRIMPHDRLRVLQLPGIARLVGFNGIPAPLPEEEVEVLRRGMLGGAQARPHPFLTIGRRVQVKTGPMAGMRGILIQRKGKFRVVVSIEQIQRSMAVEIASVNVEPLLSKSQPQRTQSW